VDNLWVHHLTDLDNLREGIGLRAYGQQDPLVAYKREAHEMYGTLLDQIQHDILRQLYLARNIRVPRSRPTREMHTNVEAEAQASRPRRRTAGGDSKERPGRNEPCWCGSGKKYKYCHMRQDRAASTGRPDKRTPAPATKSARSARSKASRRAKKRKRRKKK
jgi:preprotein translocase subunit SecA